MDQVPVDTHLSNDDSHADRRRGGPVGRSRRLLIAIVRSRTVAMFAIAFAVSWGFHQVDEIQNRKFERQQRIIQCTIERVALAQDRLDGRLKVEPILQQCTIQQGKE